MPRSLPLAAVRRGEIGPTTTLILSAGGSAIFGLVTFEEETDVFGGGGVSNPERTEVSVLVLSGPEAGKQFSLSKGRTLIGRSDAAVIRLTDQAVSRQHAAIEWRTGLPVIHDLGSKFGTFVEGSRVDKAELQDGFRFHLSGNTVLCVRFYDPRERHLLGKLEIAATRDPLTGVSNRRDLMERLEGEISFARRHRTAFAVLMVDVDHFKSVNDDLGHDAGDVALLAITNHMRDLCRAEDLIARFGGDEFVIMARGTDSGGGAQLADRLLKSVRRHSIHLGSTQRSLTVSIGVAGMGGPRDLDPSRTAAELLARADAALYAAKAEGRDQMYRWLEGTSETEDASSGLQHTVEMELPKSLRKLLKID